MIMRTLLMPPAAEKDKDSLEMLRAWIIDGDLQVALSSWVWKEDVAPWGQLLAETIQHLSTALAIEVKKPKAEIAVAIKKSLDHHFAHPRDCLIGDFAEPPLRKKTR
jgi:hypothetical protein